MGNSKLKNVTICKKCGRFYKGICKCKPVWNKGLTKNDEIVLKYAEKQKGTENSMYGKMNGKLNPNWKKGKMSIKGYTYILNPEHPRAKKSNKYGGKYIAEHILIMEKHIGRYLRGKEVIHHIDGKRSNNNIKNLKLCLDNGEHRRLHNKSGINWKNKNDLNKYMKDYRNGKRYYK